VTSAAAPAMVPLGYGKHVRADRIFALERIDDERGDGRRTRVWVDGIAEPLIASRTERTILADMVRALPRRQQRPRHPHDAQTALFE
jgi:hypothetical protein